MMNPANLRLLILGTGPFAVPMFRGLLSSRHEVLGLVTRPDRPVHRREKTPHNPMRAVAQEHALEVFEPESINSPEALAWLRDRQADLLVVCDYGQILKPPALVAARLGGINLHASLLPKYRGAAPINWAIYHGEPETGVTVIHMTPLLDGGPSLVQRRVAIEPDEATPQLEARLAELGVSAVLNAIDLLASGATERKQGLIQDETLATKAPRLKKDDGLVDWSRTAADIVNQVRAFQPWPKTFTFLKREAENEPLRLILERARPVMSPAADIEPGTIIVAFGTELIVACGGGQAVAIDQLQPAGKRAMSAAEFLRGQPIKAGQRFGKKT